MDWSASDGLRIPVGSHYRVWWFWLPIIFGGAGLLAAAVILPIFSGVGIVVACLAGVCFVIAAIAGLIIERGRRWVELSAEGFRLSDHSVQVVIKDEQVTDLAFSRQPHHGAGKLLAETRRLLIWIDTEAGTQRLKLNSRLAPGASDPLQPLIGRLCGRLYDRAERALAARETIEGDGWALDPTQLHLSTAAQRSSIPLADLGAVETIGSEVRIWERNNPYTSARIPLSGRNAWLLERLLLRSRAIERADPRPRPNPQAGILPETSRGTSPVSPLGRVLFERASGSGPTIIFGVLGLLLGLVGGFVTWLAIEHRDPVFAAIGGLLLLLSGLCFAAGIRIRRVCFRCFEHGLERTTMTGRRLLRFDDIDVFSFESRRNQSHGRYTGTTYTIVCADRSREQDRGIFYSTTIRNHDEELDDLRERISQIIARRMASTFAVHKSVQWTPEVWFRRDSLEYSRRRRLFVPSKVVVIPYDTITDFEVRDGLLHIWTSYQDRAVLSISAGTPNFYPGLIVLEGLARTWSEQPSASAV